MITVEGTIPFPPGTNAPALRALSTSCTTLAKVLQGGAGQVSTTTSAAGTVWTGTASSAFTAHMTNRAQVIKTNAMAIARIAPIMTAYATAMTAAEAHYSAAVLAQQAALSAMPFSAPAEAAAIAAEGVAVVALEVAGLSCAAALASVVATLGVEELQAFDPGLVAAIQQTLGVGVTALSQTVAPVLAAVLPTSATATAEVTTTSTPSTPIAPVSTLAGAMGLVDQAYAQKPGTIGVVKTGDGKFIVALPGIEGFLPSANPQNAIDAGEQMGSGSSAYEAGVKEALIKAGAKPGDSIMFVAHSQGGLTAVDLANDPTFNSTYHVTNILTAGSPVGNVRVPTGTNMLSVENTDDVVTHLNNTLGAPLHPTVQFTDEEGSIGANHSVSTTYMNEMGTSAFTSNATVQGFTTSASGYLNPAGAQTTPPTLQYFQLNSGPAPVAAPVHIDTPPIIVLPPMMTPLTGPPVLA